MEHSRSVYRAQLLEAQTNAPHQLLTKHLGPSPSATDSECKMCHVPMTGSTSSLRHDRNPAGERGCRMIACEECWLDWAEQCAVSYIDVTCGNCRATLLTAPGRPSHQRPPPSPSPSPPRPRREPPPRYRITRDVFSANEVWRRITVSDTIVYSFVHRDEIHALPLDEETRTWFDYWTLLPWARPHQILLDGVTYDVNYHTIWLRWRNTRTNTWNLAPLSARVLADLVVHMRHNAWGNYRALNVLRQQYYLTSQYILELRQ